MSKLFIPYGHQDISEQDVKAVVDVLQSDWLTQGPVIEKFEKAVAEYCGAKYAVAVNSATSALHLACLAARMGPSDCLWTSPNSFVASANCGLYCGSTVDFVDIDPRTYNISIQALEHKLHEAEATGALPKVLIPVHFAGQPCEMDNIAAFSKRYGVTVIEDASHAIGGRYKSTKIGSCTYSDMTVFSFHPVKIITTGEGGMVLTNKSEFYEKLIMLRSHGITRDPEKMHNVSHGPWYYEQLNLGFNYRITDIQASLGLSQFERLDTFVERRHYLARRYNEAFASLPLTAQWHHPDAYSAYHLYAICLNLDQIGKTHRQIFEDLRNAGIGVNIHYIPIHMQPYYQTLGFKNGDFPRAEQYYAQALSLPMFYGLTDSQQDQVIVAVQQVLQ